MKKPTDELLNILCESSNLDTYFNEEDENLSSIPLHDYLNGLCAKLDMTPAQCIKGSGLDRTYAYQIFSGKKIPSRDKVLALGFGFQLSLDDMQTLLKHTGYPALYPRNRRDCVIIYALQKKSSLITLNETLQDMGHKLIL